MNMIANGKNLKLTAEEGQILFQISSTFSLPEKLGKIAYSTDDQSEAIEDVRFLYRELRARSPLSQRPERWQMFGPEDLWDEITNGGGRVGYKMKPSRKDEIVLVNINDDVLSGVIWCLLVSLHPGSSALRNLTTQEEILWPIADKVKRTKILREMIGLSTTTLPKRWKSDDEFDDSKDVKSDSDKK